MKKNFIVIIGIILCISIFILYYNKPKDSAIKEMAIKNVNSIEQVASDYYENLSKQNFSKALEYVQYTNNDKDEAIKWLTDKSNSYCISKPKYINDLIREIDYSNKLQQYRVVSLIDLNEENTSKQINEYLYIKKVDNVYKIIRIESDDENISHRSSESDNRGNSIYDSNIYLSLY